LETAAAPIPHRDEPTWSPDRLRALIVFNPVAPHADRERLERVFQEVFRPTGGRVRFFETSTSEDLDGRIDRELDRAYDEGCDLAVAAGGDGTVSALANRLSRRESKGASMLLGVVPLGTANVLARELAIPVDVEAAAAVIAERRRIVALDAIETGEHRILTQVGVGLDASMIQETSRESLIKLKRLAYLIALLRKALGHRSRWYRIVADGRVQRVRAWQVVVANAGTFGAQPLRWGPGVNPTDGVLDVCVYDVRRIADTLGLAWTLFTGWRRGDPRVRIIRVRREVTIDSMSRLPAQGDGDLIGETPITMRIVPGAVSIVAPEPPEVVARESEEGAARAHTAQLRSQPALPAPGPTGPIPAHTRARAAQHVLLHHIATLEAIDAGLFLAINNLHLTPGSVVWDRLATVVSRLMDHGELWVMIALAAGLTDPGGGRVPLEVVPALWLSMLIVNYPLKSLFRRRRPFVSYVKARVLGRKPQDSSFPSGHTAAAFAGAVLLTPVLPVAGPFFYVYAVTVGLSRVYLGVHYPSDVVMGAVIGGALAVALGALVRAIVPG
jgi:diacylglycerol kinase family enzyme/membrane-associated phospholipid phosphatase